MQMDQNICRLCSENCAFISLFEFDAEDARIQLSAKVMHCAKVEIVQGDGLPANICVHCEESLASAYRFVLKCEETDQKLRALQLTLKQECDTKSELKSEIDDDDDDNFPSEYSFENPSVSPPIEDQLVVVRTKRKEEQPVVVRTKRKEVQPIVVRTKRKYMKSSVKRESTKCDPIECKICGRVCQNRSTFIIHMRSHTNEKPHACPTCDKRYKDGGSLKRHIERNHKDVVVRTKRKYVRRSNIQRESTKCDPIECKVCERVCQNRSTFIIHMRSHTNEKPHICPSCVKRYKDSGSLKRHIERNHEDVRQRTYICEHCGKAFYSKADCKIHMRIHTRETPFACTHCSRRFTQIGSLHRHTLTHTGERSHMCSKCSKKFPTSQQLRSHYLVHTNEKKFSCPMCNMAFKYSNSMRKHLSRHTDGRLRKFICDYCNSHYTSKGNLQIHIQKVHSIKSGYCNECSKHFPNLEIHMWKHKGVRHFKCEFCPSSFFGLRGLSTHVSFQHKNPTKFKCTMNDCIAQFPVRAMLDYHVTRYHKSVKPFSCDKCPRRFYRNSDMVRHKKGSHKESTETISLPKAIPVQYNQHQS